LLSRRQGFLLERLFSYVLKLVFQLIYEKYKLSCNCFYYFIVFIAIVHHTTMVKL
jgi:hypothetical protein